MLFLAIMNKPQYQLNNVLASRARLGESPVWDATQKLLYWVDIYNYRVHQFNRATGHNSFFDVGDVVGCIGLAGANRLIMAQRDRLAFLNTQTGDITPIIQVEADKPNNRFNDGKCDPQGRFWFGSMSQEKSQASLYRYDPDNSLHLMETGLTVTNGMGWSSNGKTFYLTDSDQQKIFAYDFDSQSGKISNRRIFVDLTHESFFPDGLTVDSEGNIWSAMWEGGCVIRFDSTGKEVLRIRLPVKSPTNCTFAGEDLKLLYITTASVGLSQAEIDKSVSSGDLFEVQTDIVGLPSYHFQSSI
ncbi:SMP-30/gluconolactonase/LRE family protein [Tolypothrix bouteillei VB521301]|uniref:SMP-30/gluconolactonase/LRE family protein n=4 Tax=Nostocales TaxID=1161 RepID=A0A8S9T7Y8_9CYAN|nr:SMP-30/gluconolactonase/LRE family protein [Tolypothrix bouteillei VB521301]